MFASGSSFCHVGPLMPVVRRLCPWFARLERARTFRSSSHLRILGSGSSGEHEAWQNEETSNTAELSTKMVEPVPGGFVTHALEEVGADKVVALQKLKQDVAALQDMQADHPCLQHIIHCDVFRMDPQYFESRPPFLKADDLFEQLGLQAGNWNGVIPLRVLAFLPLSTARKLLWQQAFNIFYRTSIYRLGRVELNLIMSEQLYQKLIADVGSKDYRCFAVLWQESCHITLLHTEPKTSFLCNKETSSHLNIKKFPNMCFVRLTPRKDLFTINMEPALVEMFCSMVYQCLALPSKKLIDKLNLWSLGRGCEIMTAAGLDPDVKSREISPLSYRHLFLTLIEHQDAIMVSKEMLIKSVSLQN
uniref:dimethyladenosine transferase 2, mitochondrial isoform X2 n=1 Tax=Myxine glutinosa TaxID=7769 RepID=UPI00358EFFD3